MTRAADPSSRPSAQSTAPGPRSVPWRRRMSMLEHLLSEKDFRTFGEEYQRVRRKLLLNPRDRVVQREAQKVARAFRRAQKDFARTLAKLSALPQRAGLSPCE